MFNATKKYMVGSVQLSNAVNFIVCFLLYSLMSNVCFLASPAKGYSVYIKGLPVSATHALLEEEFKKFGPIKPNGIQVQSNRLQGFSFGFVEFEVPDAVQNAIKASPFKRMMRKS